MRSMTAHASVHKSVDSQNIQVVLRSLNFKYLDVNIRNSFVENILLEEEIKREIKKKFYRGKVEVFIFSSHPHSKKIMIDEKVVASYVHQVKTLSKKYKLKGDIQASDILSLPQVITWEQKSRGDNTSLMPIFKEALKKLNDFKEKEGKVIAKEMLSNLSKLKNNIQKIQKQKPKITHKENGKDDIDEELSLGYFYITKLESKIKSKKAGPKGKSVDFLTQEILRELNAASSKTKAKKLALLLVEAKNYLERIREQAQNIE
jgi:uncharacterized protein (TIGR00255 family)